MYTLSGLSWWLSGKESSARATEDIGWIPESGRFLGGGRGNPLQYSCLEKPMDRGAWQATVHGVAELDTTEATYTCMHTLSGGVNNYGCRRRDSFWSTHGKELIFYFTWRKVFLIPSFNYLGRIYHTGEPDFCGIFISLLETCPIPLFCLYLTDHKAESTIKLLNLPILEIFLDFIRPNGINQEWESSFVFVLKPADRGLLSCSLKKVGKKWNIAQKMIYVCVLVTQLCPTLCNPTDGSLPGSSVHRILQARILEWVTSFFFRGSSWSRDWTQVSCIAGGFFTIWATRRPNLYIQFSSVQSLRRVRLFAVP